MWMTIVVKYWTWLWKLVHEKAGKASFEGPICDFKNSLEVGLKVHIGNKDSNNIEQIDGHWEVEDENRYENTEDYWREGRLGNAYFTCGCNASYLTLRHNGVLLIYQ